MPKFRIVSLKKFDSDKFQFYIQKRSFFSWRLLRSSNGVVNRDLTFLKYDDAERYLQINCYTDKNQVFKNGNLYIISYFYEGYPGPR